MRSLTLRLGILAAVLALVTCGGGGSGGNRSPVQPTPVAPTPPPPPHPPDKWALSAQVVQYSTNRPIAGATVSISGADPVTTGADGRFAIGADTKPGWDPMPVTIEAAGHLTRKTFLDWQRGDRSTTIDLIPGAAPFSATFFRDLLHDTYDFPDAPEEFLRWEESPRFYIKTVDQRGRSVPGDLLTAIRQAIPSAVRAFTGGVLSATIEEGRESRPMTPGWINVVIFDDDAERDVCGRAFVGENPGRITLNLDVCQCGSMKMPPSVVAHEVGHALGVYPVSDRESVMLPYHKGGCRPAELSSRERYHAPLAYRRTSGHTAPDTDTDAMPLSARRRREVIN